MATSTVVNMWNTTDFPGELLATGLIGSGLRANLSDELDVSQLDVGYASLLAPDAADLVLDSNHTIDVDELYLGLADGGEAERRSGVKREPATPPSPDGSDSGVDLSPAYIEYEGYRPVTPSHQLTAPRRVNVARPGEQRRDLHPTQSPLVCRLPVSSRTYIITTSSAAPAPLLASNQRHVGPAVLNRVPSHPPGRPVPARPAARQVDSHVLKRQERMIKNRISACLSRKKRKDQFVLLEARTRQLKVENVRLCDENQQLHDRLTQLAAKVTMMRQSQTSAAPPSPPSPERRSLVLFSIILMAGLNLTPLGWPVWGSSLPHSPGGPTAGGRPGGRTLLSVASQPPEGGAASVGANGSISCPRHLSQTESRRLSEVLHSWFGPSQRVTPVVDRPRFRLTKLARKPAKRVPGGQQRRRRVELRRQSSPAAALMARVRRRDDTFYVVSASGHRLLLPALSHNQTQRPRMALLLPSSPLNETMRAPDQHVAMMQIDCEVVNTRLLHIPEALVPATNRNATGGAGEPSAAASATREYQHKQKFNLSPLDGYEDDLPTKLNVASVGGKRGRKTERSQENRRRKGRDTSITFRPQ